jgi:hypothetical protein
VYITIAITIVLIAAISVLSGFAYIEARNHLIEIENGQREAADTALVEYHREMDRDLAFFDDLFTARLRAVFPAFLNEYEQAERNPLRMDLASLKAGSTPGTTSTSSMPAG